MQLYVIAAKALTASGTTRLIASKSHRFPLNAGIVVNQLEGVLRKIQAAGQALWRANSYPAAYKLARRR